MADDDNIMVAPQVNVGMTENQFADATRLILEEVDRPYDVDENSKIKVNVGSLTRPMQHKVKLKYAQAGVLSSMKKNGMGKSSLGYHIGSKIAGNKFSFEKNFFFDGDLDDIKAQTDALSNGNVLFMDELVRVWYNRQAMSRKSIDLNKWMAADQRKTGVILWGAIPDFWMIDPYLREGRIDVYVECLARGVGIVFRAQNFVKTDPWHADVFDKLSKFRSKKKGRSTLTRDIDILQKHPCYDGLVFWNRMPPFVEAEYLGVLKRKLADAAGDLGEDKLERFKREYATEREQEKFLAWQAVVNLVHFMTEGRGVPQSRVLKEAGISATELRKYEKFFEKKDRQTVDTAIDKEVSSILGGGRLERKPTVQPSVVVEDGLENIAQPEQQSLASLLPPPTNQEVVMEKPKLSFADRFPNLSNKRKFEELELADFEKKKKIASGETVEEEENDGDDADEEADKEETGQERQL